MGPPPLNIILKRKSLGFHQISFKFRNFGLVRWAHITFPTVRTLLWLHVPGKRKIAEYLSPCGKIGVKRQGAERS